jgi:tRNA (cmo5U34)-methyltransferase
MNTQLYEKVVEPTHFKCLKGSHPNPNQNEKIKFSFSNFSTNFDEHINKSIRGFSNLFNDVVSLSRYFIEEDTSVLDLGCSQGTLLEEIKKTNDQVKSTKFIGVDINENFKPHWNNKPNLSFVVDDITKMKFPNNLSFVTSIFILQFLPHKVRYNLLKKIYDNLNLGGSLTIGTKILSPNSKLQQMFEFIYYDYKKKSFSEKQILDKEVELRHLSKLITEDQLTTQLNSIGFQNIECFWRNHNFIGLTMTKGSDCEIKI